MKFLKFSLCTSFYTFSILMQIGCDGFEKSKSNSSVKNDLTKQLFVNIIDFNNKFICADEAKSDTLFANRTQASAWEKFTFIYLDSNVVALKSIKNKYISTDSASGYFLLANKNTIEESSKFEILKLENEDFAFKTIFGTYLCSDQDIYGKLIANRHAIGKWEKFKIIKILE
ncbi:MAG: hypothetical protein IPK91_15190 [Saprospiraceae bacterium]|nr:hypothetical protein [Saprospiraceae bacterium]